MTNEKLLEQMANGDEAALTTLCLMNIGLVKERARLIARQYHCLRQTQYGWFERLRKRNALGTGERGKAGIDRVYTHRQL